MKTVPTKCCLSRKEDIDIFLSLCASTFKKTHHEKVNDDFDDPTRMAIQVRK